MGETRQSLCSEWIKNTTGFQPSSIGLGFFKSDAQAKTLGHDIILYSVKKQRGCTCPSHKFVSLCLKFEATERYKYLP